MKTVPWQNFKNLFKGGKEPESKNSEYKGHQAGHVVLFLDPKLLNITAARFVL
jgi:hypothetical protein